MKVQEPLGYTSTIRLYITVHCVRSMHESPPPGVEKYKSCTLNVWAWNLLPTLHELSWALRWYSDFTFVHNYSGREAAVLRLTLTLRRGSAMSTCSKHQPWMLRTFTQCECSTYTAAQARLYTQGLRSGTPIT